MECKSQLAAGSFQQLGKCRWEETLVDGRPEHTGSSWLNQGAKVIVSQRHMPGFGGRCKDWRSKLGHIAETQVAKLDFDSMVEKVVPVGRRIPEAVHTWSQPCHLPFEQWLVRLVLKPRAWIRVSRDVQK